MNKNIFPKIIDDLFLLSGIAGAFIIIYGQQTHIPDFAHFLGSLLLLLTAAHFKLNYFMALELIRTAGHGASLLNVGPYLQSTIPLLLSLQLFFYYCMTGLWKNPFLFLGITGLGFLSLSFTYPSQWIYMIGGLSIAAYAFYCVSQGQKVCYIWAILNSIFGLTAAYLLLERTIYG